MSQQQFHNIQYCEDWLLFYVNHITPNNRRSDITYIPFSLILKNVSNCGISLVHMWFHWGYLRGDINCPRLSISSIQWETPVTKKRNIYFIETRIHCCDRWTNFTMSPNISPDGFGTGILLGLWPLQTLVPNPPVKIVQYNITTTVPQYPISKICP